jgi:spore coat polysaccharide biosynthesis protein SpsF (cytidylyltransferase family)
MGSTRFPGKVLYPVCGTPLIQRMYNRLLTSKLVNQFLVAIPSTVEDDQLALFLETKKIPFYRGSDWNVLERFYCAAKSLGAQYGDTIVRICADNPLHSGVVVDEVLTNFFEAKVDYFSNSNKEPDILEDGFDVEVCSFEALESAHKKADLLSQREHVMPYIKDSGLFKCEWKKVNPEYRYKLSFDTNDDLKTIENIINALNDRPDFSIHNVVEVIKNNPELISPNKNSLINSGYKISIENDRKI